MNGMENVIKQWKLMSYTISMPHLEKETIIEMTTFSFLSDTKGVLSALRILIPLGIELLIII